MTGNVPVTNISTETHELLVLTLVAQDCYERSGQYVRNNETFLRAAPFTISNSKNMLFLVVTQLHTFVGTKTKNLNALAFAMWSMILALALGVARYGLRMD
jgi:predicted ferric reductase